MASGTAAAILLPVPRLRRAASIVVTCIGLGAVACAPAVSVRRADFATVNRELTASVLSTGRPSAYSSTTLRVANLYEPFRREPAETLAKLHGMYVEYGYHALLFALSELSFTHALRSDDHRYFLAAAVYAYAFVLPDDPEDEPEPSDPRFRTAIDLYNRGLNRALESEDGSEVLLEHGRRPLPFGTMDISVDPSDFQWGDVVLERFVPVADLEIRGLDNRHRRPGIGMPLAARRLERGTEEDPDDVPAGNRWLSPDATAAVTAFLRIDDVHAGLLSGRLTADLELYAADLFDTVEVDGAEVPLELELSSALAYSMADSPLWDFEVAGFRIGDLGPEAMRSDARGLLMVEPYRPGRVPVVFVHGTATSPLRWANMANDLKNDPKLRGRLQHWYFMYNSGNPLAVSAAALRQALEEAVAELDPDGRDPALRQMVLVGHSQGGLICKMMVVDSGDRFWSLVSPVPLAELDVQPETREILEESLFFEALPSVRRVVFIATPHQGAFIADQRIVRWLRHLVRLPSRIVDMGDDLVDALLDDPEAEASRSMWRVPTSLDNMRASDPFLQTLAETPIADGVSAHSIIAVLGDGPPEEGDDGVVTFESQNLGGVESMRVVRSGHSAQHHPDTIAEVRRILLRELDGPEPTAAVAPRAPCWSGPRPALGRGWRGARRPSTVRPRIPTRTRVGVRRSTRCHARRGGAIG